jgi:hypothetical protein
LGFTEKKKETSVLHPFLSKRGYTFFSKIFMLLRKVYPVFESALMKGCFEFSQKKNGKQKTKKNEMKRNEKKTMNEKQ